MAYQTQNSRPAKSSNGAAWFIAGALVVALIAGAFMYSEGFFTQDDQASIELKLPSLDAK